MEKHLNPEDAPRMVVAVPSLTPEFALWNSATKTLSNVFGGNLEHNTAYIYGDTDKDFRLAAEDGSYECELILRPLPRTIEEIPLNERPECKLVILNAEVVEIPKPKKGRKQQCVMVEHWATTEYKSKKKRKAGAKVLPLFPDFQPQTQTA